MQKDRFSQLEAQALRQNDELLLDTIRFFRNANEIYYRFEDWKDIDRFYFIPLKIQMTYFIDGHVMKMANDPIHLGTFVRNTLEHQDLFAAPCPRCGRHLFPYSYNGSPLSGRVALEAICPECGWNDHVFVTGWKERSELLRGTQRNDRLRMLKMKITHPKQSVSTINNLLQWKWLK